MQGCRELAKLVGEVEDLRQMTEIMKRMVMGHGLEEKGGKRGDQVARLEEAEEAEEKEKCEEVVTPDDISTEESRNEKEIAERNSSEDRDTAMEIEGEDGIEGDTSGRQIEVKNILCSGGSWQRNRTRRTG